MKKIVRYLVLLILLGVFIPLAWGKLGAFFCNQGNYYFERLDYKKAVTFYENSIRINPKAWMAHLGLADTYRELKNYRASAKEYKRVLEINPSCARAYNSLADVFYQEANYREALGVLLKGQKENPELAQLKDSFKKCCEAYFADTLDRSTDLFLAGKSKEAISALQNVLAPCPGNALLYYTLGYYYLSGQDYNNAEINLNKSILADPQFYYAYKLLSDIYLKKGNIEKTIFFAQKAVFLNSKDASNQNELGLLLMRLERYAEALPYLKEAVYLNPNNLDYLYSLASVYRDNKMYKQAIVEYEKLVILKDDYPNLHNDLAEIYIVLNRTAEATVEFQKEIQYCREKIKNSPNDPMFLNNYAYALNGSGQSDKAKDVAEGLAVSHPRYQQVYFTLSKIYEKMNMRDLALKSLEKAKQLSSGENFIDEEISRVKSSPLVKNDKYVEGDDWVYLKNGRKFRGRIKKENMDKIVLEVLSGDALGELAFYRDTIERIEKNKK